MASPFQAYVWSYNERHSGAWEIFCHSAHMALCYVPCPYAWKVCTKPLDKRSFVWRPFPFECNFDEFQRVIFCKVFYTKAGMWPSVMGSKGN